MAFKTVKYAPCPLEALRLAEDIQTLELIMDLLDKVDLSSIDVDKQTASKTVWRISLLVSTARNYARDQLRHLYLADRVLKPRQKTQTLWDVWQLFKEATLNNSTKPEQPLSKATTNQGKDTQ